MPSRGTLKSRPCEHHDVQQSQVCTWPEAIPHISTVERGERTGSSCEEKDLGILVDSQTHAGYEMAVCVCSPECHMCHGLPQKQCDQPGEGGGVILPLYPALMRAHLEHCISSGVPNIRWMWADLLG